MDFVKSSIARKSEILEKKSNAKQKLTENKKPAPQGTVAAGLIREEGRGGCPLEGLLARWLLPHPSLLIGCEGCSSCGPALLQGSVARGGAVCQTVLAVNQQHRMELPEALSQRWGGANVVHLQNGYQASRSAHEVRGQPPQIR